MEIFMDLITTLGLVLPVFVVVLVLSIGIVLLISWLWDRRTANPQPQSPLAEFYETYADSAEAKQRMETLIRPAEGSESHWIDALLTKYLLSLEIDADKAVMRLTDRKFFDLKKKSVELPIAMAVGLDYPAAKRLLSRARFNFNRRAKRQGIVSAKRSQGVSA